MQKCYVRWLMFLTGQSRKRPVCALPCTGTQKKIRINLIQSESKITNIVCLRGLYKLHSFKILSLDPQTTSGKSEKKL